MSADDIAEFLDCTELTQGQKNRIQNSSDKEGSLLRIMRWRYIAKASSEYYEFSLMLHKLGIFIPKELKDQFAEDADACNKAIAHRSTEFDHGPIVDLKHDQDFLRRGEVKLEALKDAVRKRLLHG